MSHETVLRVSTNWRPLNQGARGKENARLEDSVRGLSRKRPSGRGNCSLTALVLAHVLAREFPIRRCLSILLSSRGGNNKNRTFTAASLGPRGLFSFSLPLPFFPIHGVSTRPESIRARRQDCKTPRSP